METGPYKRKYIIDKVFENGTWYLWADFMPTPWTGELETLFERIRKLEKDQPTDALAS